MLNTNEENMIGEWSTTYWKLEMTDRRRNFAVVTLVLPRYHSQWCERER
jgi:hypothetical protein